MRACRSTAALVLVALVASPALADWKDDYSRGLEAVRDGRWGEAARYMDSALAGNAQAPRLRLYGQRYEVYAPQHYGGLARCARAIAPQHCAIGTRGPTAHSWPRTRNSRTSSNAGGPIAARHWPARASRPRPQRRRARAPSQLRLRSHRRHSNPSSRPSLQYLRPRSRPRRRRPNRRSWPSSARSCRRRRKRCGRYSKRISPVGMPRCCASARGPRAIRESAGTCRPCVRPPPTSLHSSAAANRQTPQRSRDRR